MIVGMKGRVRRTSSVRWVATASLIAAGTFLTILGYALLRTPDFTATDFLSGLGAQGAPAAFAYRLALVAAALSASLLGISLQLAYSHAAALGWLLAAAALLGTSSLLPCDPGCPIPVVESGGGVVNAAHFFVTAAAFLLLVVAVQRLVIRCPDRFLCRLSLVAMVAVGPLMAVLAVLLLFATHSVLTASVERLVLAGAFGWLVLTGARLVTASPAAPQSARPKTRGDVSR